jgi:hypothetical protein
MPGKAVNGTGSEAARSACHNRVFVPTTMDLAGITARSQTHSEIRHVLEDGHYRFSVIPNWNISIIC